MFAAQSNVRQWLRWQPRSWIVFEKNEKKIKKLSLNKESVRVLTSKEQANVNGGLMAAGSCTCLCSKLTYC
jgi:hypothetical protein